MESNKYISPSITLQEFIPEGVICASNDLSIMDWEREDDPIEF